MKKVKLAFIGAGWWANKVHYPSLAEFPDVEMSAVCDIDKERRELTSKRFGIDMTFSDYTKMLDETEPDAVYLIMPPHHIFDPVMDCLERGLNVFIEKPPGITKFQTESMASLAEKNGCLTMVGFQRRFCPVLVEARRMVEERGDITQCMVRYMKNKLNSPLYYRGVVDALTCDVIHAVDTLRWMGGEVEKVCSVISSFSSGNGDSFNAVIKFRNGAAGLLCANWSAGRRVFSVEMHSRCISSFSDPDEGSVVFRDNGKEGERMKSSDVAGGGEMYKYAGFSAENRHFIDCLKQKSLPATNFSDAVKTMDLAEKIYAGRIA